MQPVALTPVERARLDDLRQVRDGGEQFAAFVRRTCPELGTVVPRHLVRLYDLIEQTRRRAVNATISMPPRLGKSTSVRAGVVYRMVRDPSCQNFYVTFGDGLATDFAYRARKLAMVARLPLASDRANVHDWKLDGLDGGLMSTTVGGQITGRGTRGGVIVADDLIKGREAAESKLVRDKTWSYFTDDMLTRRDDNRASVLVPGTRWHPDDPIGRILRDDLGEEWDHVKLPAVVDAITGEPIDGGNRGQDFDPAHHVPIWSEGGKDLEWARKERAKGAHRWWSLYQQEPRSRDGKIFEHEPARFNLDAFTLGDGWRLNFTIDPAGTAKTSSDYWAGVVTALRGYGDACEGRALAKFHLQAKLAAVLRAAKSIRETYPIPLRIECVGGFALLPDSISMIDPLMPVEPIPRHFLRGDKMARATAYADAWNSGRFAVPLGDDWDEYIDEHLEFTGINDAHDDQVDASAHGWNLGWRGESEALIGAFLTADDSGGDE